jgi:hypothetical protein
MGNAAAINTAESMATLNTDNATVMMDSIGSLAHAKPAEPIKSLTVLFASAWLATSEILMEIALNQTLFPTAMTMKDTTADFKPASASKEVNI